MVSSGFVDGHTHPVWAGDRVHEFAMKLAGATVCFVFNFFMSTKMLYSCFIFFFFFFKYMDVHKMGGGIGFSVKHTRAATEQELLKSLVLRLKQMMRNGTTTVEVKTGMLNHIVKLNTT